MSGCALLTLLINAPTTKMLIDYLEILSHHRVKDSVFKNFLVYMQKDIIKINQEMRNDPNLQLSDWDRVILINFRSVKKVVN